jgi:hypothetical protein
MMWLPADTSQVGNKLKGYWPTISDDALAGYLQSLSTYSVSDVLEAIETTFRSQEKFRRPTVAEIKKHLQVGSHVQTEREKILTRLKELSFQHAVVTGSSGREYEIHEQGLISPVDEPIAAIRGVLLYSEMSTETIRRITEEARFRVSPNAREA